MRKKIAAGNWKMNKNFDEGIDLAQSILAQYREEKGAELILIPPFIHLSEIVKIGKPKGISVGAQNCHHEANGAYTGEISAQQLASLNIDYCLVGHSERRKYFKESNEELLGKIKGLISEGVKPIFCCGELLEDRKRDLHFKTVGEQLKVLWSLSPEEFENVVVAYEPVWAIGTGETATAVQAQEMHEFIRALIKEHYRKKKSQECSILYGGSCNPENADELFSQEDVDGGLIGGASLQAESFISIFKALK